MRKNPNITVGKALRPTVFYALKLAVFSVIAVAPVLLLSPRLISVFAGRGRVISLGVPFIINAVIFAETGILLLVLTRDKQAVTVARALRRK